MCGPRCRTRKSRRLRRANARAVPSLSAVLREVRDERFNQDAKWGQQNHPDAPSVCACASVGIPTADDARFNCDSESFAGEVTWAHILVEEVSEAVDAARDPEQLRAELVQVAAVVIAWIQAIDRRQS